MEQNVPTLWLRTLGIGFLYCNVIGEIVQAQNPDRRYNEFELTALKQVFRSQLTKGLELPVLDAETLDELISNDLVIKDPPTQRLLLTKKGRSRLRVVLTGGAYDLVHAGHVHTLHAAALLGDFLVVVVATDQSVNASKKRAPIQSMDERLKLMNALKPVDQAIPGDPVDMMETVRRVRPNTVVLGSDQFHNQAKLRKRLDDLGFSDVQIVRLDVDYKGLSTSKLIKRILDLHEDEALNM